MKASKLVHKILKFINYANLCKFTEPRKGPGVQLAFILFFYIFFHVPSGASYLYFSHSNFFFFSPFPGHQMFIFWPVENCTTWNLRYLMLRDAGWALRHWRSCSKFSTILTPSYFGTQQNRHLTASRNTDRALALKTKTMWTNGAIHYATVDSPGRREAKNSCCSKDR